ncbi:MAG: hypothetical protein GQ540_04525 [Lutibacter sp.]|uniref:hypothetical protein n=1 Tax=Lutibacter sp. TaxID=1925666 RepID=UPI0019F64B57|nr:hypothetical protein [Lutibacter sp.]NOR27777.1 hypothetical protein [Lutibacter sp.]
MHIKFFIFFFLISSTILGQEIGSVKNGNHSIKLYKSNNLFSFVYSDVNSKAFYTEKSFNFPNIDTMYAIVMDGFNHHKDHQVIVQTNVDTIVKFEFKKVNGKKMLMIRQNSLVSKIVGRSTFFTEDEIVKLFENI